MILHLRRTGSSESQVKNVPPPSNFVPPLRDLLRERGFLLSTFYAVNPPYAYVAIVKEQGTGRLYYYVLEPPLNGEEKKVIEEVKQLLREESRDLFTLDYRSIDSDKVRTYLEERIRYIVREYDVRLPRPESLGKITYYVLRDLVGYGKIDPLMRDPHLEDIMCDGVRSPVYVWHRDYESLPTNIVFEDEEELNTLVARLAYLAGKQLTSADPIVEGSLPDGSRIHITLGEISRRGASFSIRKFGVERFTIIDLIIQNTLSVEEAAYLWYLIDNMRSIIIVGSTGAGKTTLLNALAMFIRPECRIITIEEVPELRLPHEHWVPLVTRPSKEPYVRDVTLFELLKSSLRMRPDYIIVGEIRGEEAYVLFQALATGHSGMCTMHAETVDYAIKRLLTRPMNIPPILIPLANVFIHISRVKLGEKIVRRVTTIYEVEGVDEEGRVHLREVFRWSAIGDKHEKVNQSIVLEQVAKLKFITMTDVEKEISRRITVLRALAEARIRDFETVSKVIREYYYRPEQVYLRALRGVLP